MSVAAVSAVDDVNDTVGSDEVIADSLESDYPEDVSLSVDDVQEDVSASPVTINSGNYNTYFDSNGKYKGDSSDLVFSGSFSGKNFTFEKPVTISGSGSSFSNSIFTLLSGASGSTVSNLIINNNKNEVYGIFLNGASNCIIKDCTITNVGKSSYPICLGNGANYNNVTGNALKTSGADYGHGTRSTPTLLVSGSHHNTLANNTMEVEDANAIYLSSYAGGPLTGGYSNYNLIYNNSIKYNVIPTSWSYAIQVMGNNNKIQLNTIYGAYRAISAYDLNDIIGNMIINLIGRDFNNLNYKTGGDFAIDVGGYSKVANNFIINASIIGSGAGIRIGDNSIVENNYIEVITQGKGIDAIGENGIINNNTIITNSGSGIYQNKYVPGLVVTSNNITSNSGVGILIESQNSKAMPFNITIKNNLVNTSNSYAIDARGADKNCYYLIEYNSVIGDGKILTPEGVFDPSKPTYKFEGKIHNINESNFHAVINDNGGFIDIEDGDILNFTGNFYDKIIMVSKQVKITGINANFYNSSFKITSPGVQIENLNIINKKANRANAWGIFVNKVEGVRIFNNNIEVNDPNAAYAIYVLGSTFAEIKGNNLTSSGDFLTFTLLIYESSDCILSNNKIITIGTSVVYNLDNGVCIDGDTICLDGETICIDGGEVCLDGETICIDGGEVCLDGEELSIDNRFSVPGAHVVSEIYRTYGILMISSSNTNVSGNRVLATSKLSNQTDNSTNAIVGIDAYFNSHNNIFSNNNVFISAKDKYIYGMGVLGQDTMSGMPKNQGGSDNVFENNNISLVGSYYSCGIIIGYGSVNTSVSNNKINVSSDVSYGINLEISKASVIINNNLTLNSEVAYGIEAFNSSGNYVDGNKINASGKQVYGMIFSGPNNIIINNDILANGNGETPSFPNRDALGYGNAGICLTGSSTGNIVKSNFIISQTGFAINTTATGNTFEDNYLNSEKGNSTAAISYISGNIISGNYIYYIENVTINELSSSYLDEVIFNLTTGNELCGALIKIYDMDDNLIGETNIVNNNTILSVKLADDFTPASYNLKIVISKENYKTTTFEQFLTINQGNPTVYVNNISIKPGLNGKFMVIVKNRNGKGIPGLTINFHYFLPSNPIAFTGKTDKDGILIVIHKFDQSFDVENEVEVYVNVLESEYYLSTESIFKVSVLDIAPVTININSKVGFGGVVATLTDNNDLPVANKQVSVNIDGKNYNVNTDANGQVILPSVSAGSHAIAISSAKDSNYDVASGSAKVTVVAPITGNKNVNVYFGNTAQYKIRVADKSGNYLSYKTVTVKVNGKNVNLKTDANGYATYSVKKVGTYTITAELNGQKVSNKIVIKPTLIAKNVVKKKAKKIKFTVKLVNKKGKVLKNKKITIKVKNKKYKVKTNKKGIATLTLKKLKVGKYTVKSSYGGCTISNTIKIKK